MLIFFCSYLLLLYCKISQIQASCVMKRVKKMKRNSRVQSFPTGHLSSCTCTQRSHTTGSARTGYAGPCGADDPPWGNLVLSTPFFFFLLAGSTYLPSLLRVCTCPTEKFRLLPPTRRRFLFKPVLSFNSVNRVSSFQFGRWISRQTGFRYRLSSPSPDVPRSRNKLPHRLFDSISDLSPC